MRLIGDTVESLSESGISVSSPQSMRAAYGYQHTSGQKNCIRETY